MKALPTFLIAPALLAAFSALAMPAAAAGACGEYVYLKDGHFMLEGKPYAFKYVNFHLDFVRSLKPGRPGTEAADYRYFLAPSGNYEPDNNSWCRDPASWGYPLDCCRARSTCAKKLEDHLGRIQQVRANGVRLLVPGLKIDSVGNHNHPYVEVSQLDSFTAGRLRFDVPFERNLALGLYLQAVQLLGQHGLRVILLLEGKRVYAVDAAQNQIYRRYLRWLSATLKGETALLAYDLFNEPVYHDTSLQLTRFQTRDLFASWVNAIRVQADNPYHLITFGTATPADSLDEWDPSVLPIDFTSYHIYPVEPLEGVGNEFVRQQIYAAALGSCGVECPFLGAYDGANCLVAAGALTTQGSIQGDVMYTTQRPDGCQTGTPQGSLCRLASFDPGRDHPFLLDQPAFYVTTPNAGTCPAGSSWDGANCLVAWGPPGAEGFVRTAGTARLFYYKPLTDSGLPCKQPAVYDAYGCRLAVIPAGHPEFIIYRPLFYVTPNRCAPTRKPMILGETGLPLAAYELDGSVKIVKDDKGIAMPDAYGDPLKKGWGTPAEQASFAGMVSAESFRCAFQGIAWWLLADVHWGTQDDHMGLFTYWYFPLYNENVTLAQRWAHLQIDEMSLQPAGAVFRDSVDYLAPRSECGEPVSFHTPFVELKPGMTHQFLYAGLVVEAGSRKPVANALVNSWAKGWDHRVVTYTDREGRYAIPSNLVRSHFRAADFGAAGLLVDMGNVVPVAGCVTPVPDLEINRYAASDLPAYSPPSQRVLVCR
jgi:hypothetical protein